MTNSRLIVGCASICMIIRCRICGNNTWMLSANGYRNAGIYRFTTFVLPIIPSIWLLIQFHGDFTGNFCELPFPTANVLLLLMTEFTKVFMSIVGWWLKYSYICSTSDLIYLSHIIQVLLCLFDNFIIDILRMIGMLVNIRKLMI